MFRLIRWLISLALLAAFIWFAVSVKLGKRTLWQHLRAIAHTREVQDLTDGTMDQARKTADKLREQSKDAPPDKKHEAKPLDSLTNKDRKGLDDLVKEKSR